MNASKVNKLLFVIAHTDLKLCLQEELEDEEQGDEEMDDDNDYLAQYFDDGGNYLDEDDNLDDGPTY